jgi:hypothetical protein
MGYTPYDGVYKWLKMDIKTNSEASSYREIGVNQSLS